MESKILLIDSHLRRTVEEFLRSAYEDLAEVKGVDEKSVGKVKRAKEDLADAIKLISVVPWKDNQTMWEEDKKKEDYQRDKMPRMSAVGKKREEVKATYQALGKLVKAVRTGRKIKVGELEHLVGVRQGVVSELELGRFRSKTPQVAKVLEFLGIKEEAK